MGRDLKRSGRRFNTQILKSGKYHSSVAYFYELESQSSNPVKTLNFYQIEDRQTEDECMQAYWKMFTFNGQMNTLVTNGISYSDFR